MDALQIHVGWPIFAIIIIVGLGLVIATIGLGISAANRRVVTGQEGMIGAIGRVLSWNGESGHVFVHGERWRAVSPQSHLSGPVRIIGGEGLTLHVEPLAAPNPGDDRPTT